MQGTSPVSRHSPEVVRTRRERLVSLLTVVVLFLLAWGGAARHADGVLLGVPPAVSFVSASLAGVAVWASGVSGLGGFLLPAGAIVLASFFPETLSPLLLFSGRPLFTFVFASLFLTLAFRGWRPPKAVLLPVFFMVYSAVAYQAQTRVGPDGDEPQYLMVAESLIRDHDLVLDQDFALKRYEAFFSRPLAPDFRIRGPQGQIYSLHAVGLSILILPAYALFGYAGASFFMALVAALLVRELRGLIQELTGDASLAEGTAWLVGLSPPLIHFAGLIFTEIPAALLLGLGLRLAVFDRRIRSAPLAALCAAALPWFNVRYAILSVGIVVALGWRLFREVRVASGGKGQVNPTLSSAAVLSGSALALGLYHYELWGFFDPRRVYGRRREFSLDILPEGLPGLFFDQEFGLFVYAPIFVLSIVGFIPLWRRHRTFAVAGLIAVFGVIATASMWPMWRGGFNPPARFLVPLVPILAGALALALKGGIRPATALLAGWSLWGGLFGAMNVETIHRDRDGVAPFFRTQSGAREWTAALPSFVLSEDRPTRVLVWPWAGLLATAMLVSTRRPNPNQHGLRNRDTLLAASALMAVAVFADRLSPRVRSPERDATRLLGSSSLLLPGLSYPKVTVAEWPVDLFYQPHRFPAGLTFANAVYLEMGDYEITLSSADGGSMTNSPALIVSHRRSDRSVRRPTRPGVDGLHATFTAEQSGEYDLGLIGGEPLTSRGVRLGAASPR